MVGKPLPGQNTDLWEFEHEFNHGRFTELVDSQKNVAYDYIEKAD